MFGIADYGAFVAAIVLFLLIPGPGNLALITSTSKGGIRGGMAATMGVIAGDQVLMWAAVAGVATLLATYPAAFNAVQWLGAAYLAGLATGVYAGRDELAAQWRVERRFEQLDLAVMGDQALARFRGQGRVAADDQQSAFQVFQRADALRHGRLADRQCLRSLFKAAQADHGVEGGQSTVIDDTHKILLYMVRIIHYTYIYFFFTLLK